MRFFSLRLVMGVLSGSCSLVSHASPYELLALLVLPLIRQKLVTRYSMSWATVVTCRTLSRDCLSNAPLHIRAGPQKNVKEEEFVYFGQ